VGAGVADGEPGPTTTVRPTEGDRARRRRRIDAEGPLEAPFAEPVPLGSLEAPAAEAAVDAVAEAPPAPADPDAGRALGPAEQRRERGAASKSGPLSNGDMPANAAASNRTTNARPRTASVSAAETIGGRPRRS
jgi:hypothetical protein